MHVRFFPAISQNICLEKPGKSSFAGIRRRLL